MEKSPSPRLAKQIPLASQAWPLYALTVVASLLSQEGALLLGVPLEHTLIIAPAVALVLNAVALLGAYLTLGRSSSARNP